jgi:hypothetical protein
LKQQRCGLYCMQQGQGKERRNNVTTGNDEVGQTDTRTEVKLAPTSTEHAIRQSSQAAFTLSIDRKT